MAYLSPFSRRPIAPPPTARESRPFVLNALAGLDMATPYDMMQGGRTPFAKNFRLYAEETEDRRSAVSSRKGSGFYSVPVGETNTVSITSTTGQADASLGTSVYKAQSFVPAVTGRLTKLDLRLKNVSGSGIVMVEVWSNVAGNPGVKLATTGIVSSSITTSYAYVSARFLEAPQVTSGTTYWIVAYVHSAGSGTYAWATTTTASTGLTSTTGTSWTAQNSLQYKAYVSTDMAIKGMYRYAPPTAANKTVFAAGTSVYSVDDVTGATTAIATGLNSTATYYSFTMIDGKLCWVNGKDAGIKTWDGTTVATITHSQLPTLSLLTMHKERLMGVSADDPNKLVFSEAPGNDDGAGKFWYEAWLSTSYAYFPSPKAGDPITAIVPFQDSLVVFTRSNKYVFSGDTPATFYRRQAMGNKGAVSQSGVHADENFIYYVSPDGFYRYTGSADDHLFADRIQPETSGIANLNNVFVAGWKRQIRFYYASSGSAYNNRCLIWDTSVNDGEWMMDTDSYVSHAFAYTDGNDPAQLVEASSLTASLTYAEQGDNNLGRPIDFAYYCNADGMGNPAVRKRIVRFVPFLEAEGNYSVRIGLGKDLSTSATFEDYALTTGSAVISSTNPFILDGNTLITDSQGFDARRVRVTGYAHYWQVRLEHEVANTPINFRGYALSIRTKRM